MFASKRVRCAIGIILGGCAALSLTTTVLPKVLSDAGLTEDFQVVWDLGGYTVYCVLAFAAGGWLIARAGIPRRGPLVLGGIGLLCGVVLALVAYPGQQERLLLMAVAAGGYGALGGLLFGYLLQKPREEEAGS